MDIGTCDREPIHVPGSIQPHGILLVFDEMSERAVGVAGDVEQFLGANGSILGQEARRILGRPLSDLTAALRTESDPIFLKQLTSCADHSKVDAVAHRRGGRIIVELEPASHARPSASAALADLSALSLDVIATQSSQEACARAAAAVARFSGYERAMVYQFLGDGSGKVVAEYVSGGLPSHLNQHFPESDIPKQARALYAPDALLGKNISLLFPDFADQEHLRSALQQLAQACHRPEPRARELEALRQNSSAFHVDVVTSPVKMEASYCYISVVRDATERKRVEKMKSEFVSTVSHELRTPLTSIAGSLGLLAGGAAGELPERAQRLVTIARSNSERLVRLINDFLDIEKIESGQIEFRNDPIHLNSLAEQAIEINTAYADEFGVGLLLDPAEHDPVVLGDADRLMQVGTSKNLWPTGG